MGKSVVIVGAGPSGSAAALRLKQRGVEKVTIVDKDVFPRDKTCGSGLGPNTLKVLEELGLLDEARRVGYPITSLLLRTPGNRDIVLPSEGMAVVLLRKDFDNLILQKARTLGADFHGGWKATELLREGTRVVGVRGKDASGKPAELRADYVLAADGAHAIFSWDPRPKRTISTLMGWYSGFPLIDGQMEMIFDKKISPLYGWMFPETADRVNIGICMDGEEKDGDGNWVKTHRNVREVFATFLDDHYRDKLRNATQLGKLKGHPISYTTWIRDLVGDGILYIGEGGRMTHHVTGEGIFHALQSGVYAADAFADVINHGASEARAFSHYQWQARRRFTAGFIGGHLLRGILKTPLLDVVAMGYNSPTVRGLSSRVLSVLLAGGHAPVGDGPTASSSMRIPVEHGVASPTRPHAAAN